MSESGGVAAQPLPLRRSPGLFPGRHVRLPHRLLHAHLRLGVQGVTCREIAHAALVPGQLVQVCVAQRLGGATGTSPHDPTTAAASLRHLCTIV